MSGESRTSRGPVLDTRCQILDTRYDVSECGLMISEGEPGRGLHRAIEHSEAHSYVRLDTALHWYFVLQPMRQCAVGYKHCADVL